MAGAGKQRVTSERGSTNGGSRPNGSSSGETSASDKASRSAPSVTSNVSSRPRQARAYDGNQDPQSARPDTAAVIAQFKNLDLGMAGNLALTGRDDVGFERRPKPSTLGQAIKVGINTFGVTKLPSKPIYQFDVLIGSGVEKRGLIKKVWASKALEKELGKGFIFDGNRLAWSMNRIQREIKVIVDLDAEEGRTPKPGKSNSHRVVIRETKALKFDVMMEYLGGMCSFDNQILEVINFLDHLMREWPSIKLTPIKRSFFNKTPANQPVSLGSGVEALKGVYQSMRIVHGGVGAKARLSVNVDVANGTFWCENKLHVAAVQLTGTRDASDLSAALKQGESSRHGKTLKKLRKVHVFSTHRNGKKDEFVIDKFVYQSAKSYKFEKDGKQVSIYDYYAKEYGYRIQYSDLPLVKATRGKNTMLPMEILSLEPMQRYSFKMDEKQTSNMIKFAVTPPPQRWGDIDAGLKTLNWSADPIHKHFGLEISDKKTMVDGRLIPAPIVKYGAGDAKPGTSGRWDLKGKKFLLPNPVPLKSWSVCVISGRRGGKPDKTTVESFIQNFISIYKSHGGKVENTRPEMTLAQGEDVASWVTAAWNAAGNQANARPQILVFILPDKDSVTYGRIKRSCECRYGVVSQCMQYSHVAKGQAQYISNVTMKFNAKLGGTTCRSAGPKTSGPTGIFSVPTMIIGADVSHAAPGGQTPSMAALTVSMDKLACRYAANCQTNGFRVEMIQTETINTELKSMLQSWMSQVGGGKLPQRVIYFRDGVSEGQYSQVIQQEVADIKALFKSANAGANVQMVVVIGSKRHHVRFFPERGDRNGNPLPGTLVETGTTHPYENDFYLCAHAAIKGTARPMHYHVLLNEAKMPNEELQTLIYEQSYQYMRATTPVSQHPAMYYAHIASNRAGPHDPKWAGSSSGDGVPAALQAAQPRSSSGSQGRSGSQAGGSQAGGSQGQGRSGSSSGVPTDVEKLMPMPNQGGIMNSMWYI